MGASSTERPPATIKVSEGRYAAYYHLMLNLRSPDFVLEVPVEQRPPRYGTDNRWEFSPDGQFEIFVRKDAFPVAAPKCSTFVVVRMPSTDPTLSDAGGKVAQKRELFDALAQLKDTEGESLPVAIELNPYVRVVTRDPLRLELTECNVFFRHARGAYIDHVDPLAK